MNSLFAIVAIIAMLIIAGALVGAGQRGAFSPRWLLISAGLVLLNDVMLTRCYGLLPDLLPASSWNWQGKVMALATTIIIAGRPEFGWARSGLRLRQRRGSLIASAPVIGIYCAFILLLALIFPAGRPTTEEVAFQIIMPGLEEDPFYCGILLLALGNAFPRRIRLFRVDWSWGAVFSGVLFGLAHAFSYADGAFSFDMLIMLLTMLPAFVMLWLRLRTGSVLLPIMLHNFGNVISLYI